MICCSQPGLTEALYILYIYIIIYRDESVYCDVHAVGNMAFVYNGMAR
jgi:hypothetical protein